MKKKEVQNLWKEEGNVGTMLDGRKRGRKLLEKFGGKYIRGGREEEGIDAEGGAEEER